MNRAGRSGRYAEAFAPFFLAAAGFGAASVPLWTAVWSGWLSVPGDALGLHAHEMLLGYGLAVVAGFLFNKIDRRQLWLALAAWAAARLAVHAGLLGGWAGAGLSLAFPLCVLAFAALPFARAARTAHNRVFAPVLGAFTLAELLFQLGALGLLAEGERRGVMLAVGLLSLLLLVMGGRIIPAATAGIVRDKGGFLPQRVQPALEWAGIGGLALATLLDVLLVLPPLAGAASILAGLAALARLARWRGHWCLDAPALLALHLGYAWLGAGLALKGLAQANGAMLPADALHALTVGALGTLTVTMMIRTVLQRRGLAVRFGALATAAALLPSAAALLRLGQYHSAASGLWAAAMTAAFVAILRDLHRSGGLARRRISE